MSGFLMDIINFFIKKHLPTGHEKTEEVDQGFKDRLSLLSEESNKVLEELVNRPLLVKKGDQDGVVDK